MTAMNQTLTNMRSLVRGFANAMNLVAPEVQSHHEKVAYLAYRIAEEAGLGEADRMAALYGALLHDVGSVVLADNEPLTLENVERKAAGLAHAGAELLASNPLTSRFADIVRSSQNPFAARGLIGRGVRKPLVVGQIIFLADQVSLLLDGNEPVLNQVQGIRRTFAETPSCLLLPRVSKAFDLVCEHEYVWMDMLYSPATFLEFVPANRTVSIDEALVFTGFMSLIIDFRSPFTAMHSAGVAATAERIAQLAGMSEAECKMMRIAGNLHDLGKLATPKEILEKPGKLTDEEFNVMKEHAYHTYALLKDVEGFEQITTWAALHHEKLSGDGYPFKYREGDIPLGARIMAVADVFSAISEERPYRAGMPKDQVVGILREDADRRQLSGPVVDLLMAHYDDVEACRDRESRVAGQRYFASIGQ